MGPHGGEGHFRLSGVERFGFWVLRFWGYQLVGGEVLWGGRGAGVQDLG